MTTTIKVEAHCSEDEEVVFGICYPGHDLISHETLILQNGESGQKYIYGDLQAVVSERKKK